MALWRDGAFVDDVWTKLADDVGLPEHGYHRVGIGHGVTVDRNVAVSVTRGGRRPFRPAQSAAASAAPSRARSEIAAEPPKQISDGGRSEAR